MLAGTILRGQALRPGARTRRGRRLGRQLRWLRFAPGDRGRPGPRTPRRAGAAPGRDQGAPGASGRSGPQGLRDSPSRARGDAPGSRSGATPASPATRSRPAGSRRSPGPDAGFRARGRCARRPPVASGSPRGSPGRPTRSSPGRSPTGSGRPTSGRAWSRRPSDLGFNGGIPSHPELLDWLAAEARERGWSLKAMHRLIVTSAAYRQSSRPDPAASAKDAGDRLLWRKAPTRLEAEMVRDAMLAVSGKLDPRLGGPSFMDHAMIRPPGSTSLLYVAVEPGTPGHDRRTLYRAWSRGGPERPARCLRLPRPVLDLAPTARHHDPVPGPGDDEQRAGPPPLGRPGRPPGPRGRAPTRAGRSTGPIAWRSAGIPRPDERAPGRPRGRTLRRGDSGPGPLQQRRIPLSRLIDRFRRGAFAMDRRDFFSWVGGGLAGAAAASLMLREGAARAGGPGDSQPRPARTSLPGRSGPSTSASAGR